MENCNFVTTVVPVQSCCDTLQLSVNENSSGLHITLEVYAKLKLYGYNTLYIGDKNIILHVHQEAKACTIP